MEYSLDEATPTSHVVFNVDVLVFREAQFESVQNLLQGELLLLYHSRTGHGRLHGSAAGGIKVKQMNETKRCKQRQRPVPHPEHVIMI